MLKIWGRENSVNVKKVLWCIEELGLAFEHLNAGGSYGVVDTPEYRGMNPNGLVPVLQDEGHALWESNAIVRYLCARHGGAALYPADPMRRAQADKWMDWATSSFAAPFRDVFLNTVRLPADKRNAAQAQAGWRVCADRLALVDAALAVKPYLSGDEPGMGDIPLGCFAYAWFEMPVERPALPNLQAWYQRLAQRPAYQKRVMLPLT